MSKKEVTAIESRIWGHRLHDEQTRMMTFLEFLCVFRYLETLNADRSPLFTNENCILPEYSIPKQSLLRCLILNNPFINEEYTDAPWEEWWERFNNDYQNRTLTNTTGSDPISEANLKKIKNAFSCEEQESESFNNFRKLVGLFRASAININSNKGWTRQLLFPWGKDCLFTETNLSGEADRLFFSRNGELLWLLLAHANKRDELSKLITEKIIKAQNPFEHFCHAISTLTSKEDEVKKEGRARLPFYADDKVNMAEFSRRRINILCEDLIQIFSLPISTPDIIEHASRIISLNLLCYFIEQGAKTVEVYQPSPAEENDTRRTSSYCSFFCEMLQKPYSATRRCSQDAFRRNETLSLLAIKLRFYHDPDSFITDEERSADTFDLNSIYEEREYSHKSHWGKFHRAFAKDCGLGSRLCTNAYRYSPSDELLETLAATLVRGKRILLSNFLDAAAERYGIVIGSKEYEKFYVPQGEYVGRDLLDSSELNANRKRLERRLSALGLFDWLSDGFEFVRNPFEA